MAKKFYGIAGINGYGIYSDYSKVLKSRKYVESYKIKGFKSRDEAKAYAVSTYEMLQEDERGLYRIEDIQSINWFYRRSQVKRLFKPVKPLK